MSDPSGPVPGPPVVAPAARPTRPFYWSVRRELWENRSITIAPLAVAALVLFASIIGTIGLPGRMRAVSALDPAKQHAAVVGHLCLAPAPILLAAFLVGLFYCLETLHGERRDRSVLFWKSLPVSDRMTVLSKASIPFVVLPVIGLTLGLVTQYILLLVNTAVLLGSGTSPARLWVEYRFFQDPLVTLYGVTVHVLWFAPVYGWLLLVSAWARRAPVLWAALPLLAISAVETLLFRTSYLGSLLKYRVTGALTEAFVASPRDGSGPILDRLSDLEPARFLSTPGLWVGLALTGAFLVLAVRLRRDREPI
jgi:ABC-2 type transport system permease protein